MTGRPKQPSITCPRCGRTSYHPDDIREGYCSNCHDWTSPPSPS
jgi:ribosomal protein L37E